MSMLRTIPGLFALAVISASLCAQPPNEPPGAADGLPEGARLRLGGSSLSVGDGVTGGALSPDGKYLAAVSRDGVVLFERKSGKRLAQIDDDGMPRGAMMQLAFSPNGKVLAFSSAASVVLTEVPTGKRLQRLEIADTSFQRGKGLCFSADGKVVAIGMDHRGENKKCKAFSWDAVSGKALAIVEVAQNLGCATALSPDGKVLATWGRHAANMIGEDDSAGQLVQLWDVADGKMLRALKIDRPVAQMTVAFAADGQQLTVGTGISATGTTGSTFHVFDTQSGKELRRFAGRRGLLTLLQYSPDGKMLVSGDLLGTLQAWRVSDGKRIELPGRPKGRLLSVAFPAEGQIIALSLPGQTLAWWDAVSGSAASAVVAHQTAVIGLAYAADGKTLTSAGADGKVVQWDAASGKPLRQLTLVDEAMLRQIGELGMRVRMLALSPDGRFAATSSTYPPNSVHLWNLATGQVACDFEASKTPGSYGLAFTPRGDRLAAVSGMKSVNVWDSETGQEMSKFTYEAAANNLGAAAPRIAFAPDGKALAVVTSQTDPDTGGVSGRLLLLDAANGKELTALNIAAINTPGTNPGGAVQLAANLAFAPDGKLLALPGPNQAILVLRADSGKEHRKLDTSAGGAGITALAFSPDGRTVAVAYGGQRAAGSGDAAGPETPVLEVCELASGKSRALFRGQQGGVTCLAFSPDGLTLASGSTDTTVMLWDLTGMHGLKAVALTAAETEAAYALLAKFDGQAAFAAQRKLIGSPAVTLEFLRKHLSPAKPPAVEAKKIVQWVADLDSENFETRDEAYRALDKLGTPADAALRQARAGKVSLEMRRRIDGLIDKLERGNLTPEELQAARAVEVLERIGSPAARLLLAVLADGAETATLTLEARKALGRLKQ